VTFVIFRQVLASGLYKRSSPRPLCICRGGCRCGNGAHGGG